MLTEFTIESFRGLSNVTLKNLGAINLITGDNSAGKTAVLESIYFVAAEINQIQKFPEEFRVSLSKGSNQWDSFWRWIFPQKEAPSNVAVRFISNGRNTGRLKAEIDGGVQITVTLAQDNGVSGHYNINANGGIGGATHRITNWPRTTHFNYANTDPESDAEKFSQLAATRDGEEQILGLVRIIDSRVNKLRYLKVTQSPLVYVDVGLENLIPVSQLGQGFCILFALFLEILTSKSNILLIDEIENGLHRDVLPEVWGGIAKSLASRGIQLFATTHSKECINAAYAASQDNPGVSFAHHRMSIVDGRVSCTSQEDVL